MSWNYRLIRNSMTYDGDIIYSYAIHEVYYDDNLVPNAWTKDAISLQGFEDFNDAFQSFNLMKKAFEKPPLEIVEDDEGNETLKELSVFDLTQTYKIGGNT